MNWFEKDLIPNPVSGVNYPALINDPGDGVVTRESLMGRPSRMDPGRAPLEISHSVFLCEAHQSLTGNPSFQDNLLYTLLSLEEEGAGSVSSAPSGHSFRNDNA